MSLGGGGSSSSSSRSEPWKAQQPYLKNIYGRARDLSDQPLGYYPDSTVAPEDRATQAGRAMIEQRAAQGSDNLRAAQGMNLATLRGDYLSPDANPWLANTYQRAAGDVSRNYLRTVLPALETRFAGAGRLGSGAHHSALGESARILAGELGRMGENIYGQNYQQERGRQLGAQQMAAPLAREDYYDPAQLMNVGQDRRAYSQQVLDDLVARFNFGQDEPWERLSRYGQLMDIQPVMSQRSKADSFNFNICHAAAVYFGWFTPDWYAARDFIFGGGFGEGFREWYAEHSEQLAEAIRTHPSIQDAWRPVFLRAAEG